MQNHMNTAVAVMDDLNSRQHNPDDPVVESIEAYREIRGTAEFRQAIVDFSINTEIFLASLSDEAREDILDAYTWDFEWLPELMNRLHATEVNWWAATVDQIRDVNFKMMCDVAKRESQAKGLPVKQYAHQCYFISGWDYIGSEGDGKRALFSSRAEAEQDLSNFLSNPGVTMQPEDWRVVEYVEADDDKSDL